VKSKKPNMGNLYEAKPHRVPHGARRESWTITKVDLARLVRDQLVHLQGGRDKDPGFTEPNWDYWAGVDRVETWQALMLAVDADPDDPRLAQAHERVPWLSIEHLAGHLLKPEDVLFSREMGKGPVKLADFAGRLLRIRWKHLPDRYPQPRLNPPNWNKWGQMAKAKLWQVIALSLNISPEFLVDDEPFSLGLAKRLQFPDDFFTRLKMSDNHLDDPDDGLPTLREPGNQNCEKYGASVRLKQFAAFAQRPIRHWTLPSEFPRPTATTQVSSGKIEEMAGTPSASGEPGRAADVAASTTKKAEAEGPAPAAAEASQITRPTRPEPQNGQVLLAPNSEPVLSPDPRPSTPSSSRQTVEAGDEGKPLGDREYRSLLKMIAALVACARLVQPPKAAEEIDGQIQRRQRKGPERQTIEGWLSLASALINFEHDDKWKHKRIDYEEFELGDTPDCRDLLAIIGVMAWKKGASSLSQRIGWVTDGLKELSVTTGPNAGTIRKYLVRAGTEIGEPTK